MKNALIAAVVAALVSGGSVFAAGEYWAPQEAQYRLRLNDRDLARAIILEANGEHARAKAAANFVRASTDLPPLPDDD